MYFGLSDVDKNLTEADELFVIQITTKLHHVWPLIVRRYPQLTLVTTGEGLNIGVEGVTEEIKGPLTKDFELAYKLAAVDILSEPGADSPLPDPPNG